MLKRTICWLLTLIMLFVFISCTSKTQTGNEKKTETSTDNPFEEFMTITWLVGAYTNHLLEEGRWDELELEEKFNVNIQPWKVRIDSAQMEQVHMMLAAGDVPDYGHYYTSGLYLYENGMGRTVPLDMIKQYYTGYYKLLLNDPAGFTFNLVEGKDDEFYGLAMYNAFSHYSGWVPMWRLDWLEALGYKLDNLEVMISPINPDRWNDRLYFSTTKFTINQVKDILKGFTENDPDGNGIDDTYGSAFANSAYDNYISYNMFGFDRNSSLMYKDPTTNDFVPYFAYTYYKDSLMFLTEMINLGYLRNVPGKEEYWLELRETWNSAKTGFMNTLGPPRVLGLGYSDGDSWPPAAILNDVDPNAKFVITPCAGENGAYRPHSTFNWSTMMYCIGDVSDEKLERLFRLLDYSYFSDNWIRYKWGIEGVHYKWYGEPFKSAVVFTDPANIPLKYKGSIDEFGHFGNMNFITDVRITFNFDAFFVQWIDYWERYSSDGWFGDEIWLRPDKLYSAQTMPIEKFNEFKALREQTINDISAVHNDFTKRVWAGQIADINAEWSQYITQIYAAGLDKWVKIWNDDEVKSYKYYNSLK